MTSLNTFTHGATHFTALASAQQSGQLQRDSSSSTVYQCNTMINVGSA